MMSDNKRLKTKTAEHELVFTMTRKRKDQKKLKGRKLRKELKFRETLRGWQTIGTAIGLSVMGDALILYYSLYALVVGGAAIATDPMKLLALFLLVLSSLMILVGVALLHRGKVKIGGILMLSFGVLTLLMGLLEALFVIVGSVIALTSEIIKPKR